MPSDIFAFIQAQPQAQTNIQTSTTTATQTDSAQPGLFDSLITQYAAEGEETVNTEAAAIIVQDMPEQPAAFTASNAFNQTIIAMLAVEDDTQPEQPELAMPTPEAVPEDIAAEDEEEIIWFENVPVKDNIPVEVPEAEDLQIPENIQPEDNSPIKNIINKVKNFLSDNPDADINEIISFVMNDEEIAELLPEDLKQSDYSNIKDIDDLIEVLKNIPDDSTNLQDLKNVITTHLTAPKTDTTPKAAAPALEDSDDDTDEPEDTDESAITDTDASTAGQALAPAATQDAAPAADAQESDTPRKVQTSAREVTSQPRQVRDTQPEAQNVTAQPAAATQDTAQTFREALDARTAQHEESGQDQQQEPDMPDTGNGQAQTGGDTHSSNSRSRTDTRRTNRTDRTETARQTEHTSTTATTHRTNSFQAFLEGIVNDRRAARTSATPLNLRETYNFNQAQTLRSGIVNVVRFIRTQGQQKASVIVDPPALGRISVELTSGTSGVEATIKVASEQIRQLIQDQLSQLRMNLSRQGVQVAEFTVDVQQDNSGGQSSQDQEREQRQVNIIGGADEEEPEEFRIDLEEGLLYWLA